MVNFPSGWLLEGDADLNRFFNCNPIFEKEFALTEVGGLSMDIFA
jgi:hypothetical protein